MVESIKKLDSFEEQELIKFGDSEQVVNQKFDWAKSISKKKYDEKKKQCEKHLKFFNGEQIEYQIPQYKSDSVFNYIFPGVVSNVGLLTDAKFEPQVFPLPSKDNAVFEENKEKAEALEQNLLCVWKNRQVPNKMVPALYRYIIEEDVILVPKWNYEEDEVDFEVSPITSWRFSPNAASPEESPWAIRCMEKDWNFFTERFPKKLDKIKEAIKKKGKQKDSETYEVEEYFTDEIYVMRVGDYVVDGPKENPYFEFRQKEQQLEDHETAGLAGEVGLKEVKNYFKKPKKPVIALSAYNIGELYSRSRMKQMIKPQVDINKRFQQIDDNLVMGGSGRLIYDTMMISKNEADKINFAPFQKIGVAGGKNSLAFDTGVGLVPGILDNVLQLQRGLDDISGVHEVSRGSKVRTATYGESALLKESDQTPIRLLGRNYQTALTKLVEYWTQLISLFYTQEHYAQWIDDAGVKRFLSLTREDVQPGMHITVSIGAQLSKDKADQREEDAMLAQTGAIDPLTLFESQGRQNPRKLANRVSNWKKFGIISDEQLPASGPEGSSSPPGPGQNNEQVLRMQAAHADEENQASSQGEQIQVKPDDVHQVHLEVHKSYPDQNQILVAHTAEHEEAMAGGASGASGAGGMSGGALEAGGSNGMV